MKTARALAMPAVASNGLAAGPAGNAGGDPNAPLAAQERAVCTSLGISEEGLGLGEQWNRKYGRRLDLGPPE